MSEDRVDKILLRQFPELTRSKVQSLIGKQKILVKKSDQWMPLTKPGQKFNTDEDIQFKVLHDEEIDYVSRGALKLKKAVETFSLEIKDLICLDIGLSTGGFTDYLLKSQAKKVLGVDVGSEQLHLSLRDHKQLVWKDKINARNPISEDILEDFFKDETSQHSFDLVVIDVSFISLELVAPHLKNYINVSGSVIALVKPQFELSRSDLNKKGVVKDPEMIPLVLEKISRVFAENGLKVMDNCLSPIEGENGNQEVLILAQHL